MPDNLYQRDGIWWCRFKVAGKRYRRSLRTGSLVEAKKRLKVEQEKIDHVRFHGAARVSWKSAVIEWSTAIVGAVKPAVLKRYKVSLQQCRPVLDPLYLDEITRKSIAKLIADRRRAGASNATINRDLTAVSSVLRFAVAQGWREDNPAGEYDRRVVRERRDVIEPPDDAEVEAVAAAAPAMFGEAIRFARATGMRQEEIFGLERAQVRGADVVLTKTKTSRPRVVPLSPTAKAILDRLPERLGCPFVFWHGVKESDRYHNVASQFARVRGQAQRAAAARGGAGLRPFRFHDLRHAFGVAYLRQHGRDTLPTLARIMGHSSIKTTEMYVAWLSTEGAQKGPQQDEAADGAS